MADSTARYVSSDVMNPVREVIANGEEKRYNIFLITVESLSGEYMDYIPNTSDITMPFMDSLANNRYSSPTYTLPGTQSPAAWRP